MFWTQIFLFVFKNKKISHEKFLKKITIVIQSLIWVTEKLHKVKMISKDFYENIKILFNGIEKLLESYHTLLG